MKDEQLAIMLAESQNSPNALSRRMWVGARMVFVPGNLGTSADDLRRSRDHGDRSHNLEVQLQVVVAQQGKSRGKATST